MQSSGAALLLALPGAIAGAVSAISLGGSSSTPSSQSSSVPASITAAATLPPQAVPINTCSVWNSTASRYQWADPWCSIFAGTVQLTYWPTDNETYPATVYNSQLDYTFTSPSVYMVINTLYGYNPCGPLGPSASNAIFAFDLTDVSTLVPYTDESATTRRSTRQLYLSDLNINCDASFDVSTLSTQTHPLKNDADRCNPNLIIPKEIKRFGGPYWLHCGNVNNKLGLFDPPYAISTVDGGLLGAVASAPSPASTATPTTPTPTSTSTPLAAPPTAALAKATSLPVADAPTTVPAGPATPPGLSSSSKINYAPPPDDAFAEQRQTSTVPIQVVSLGPPGLEVINDGSSSTSTYLVPGLGSPSGDSGHPTVAASVAVYQGQTLTMGGAAITVTSAAVLVSASSAGGSNSAIAIVTAGAPRLAVGFGAVSVLCGALFLLA